MPRQPGAPPPYGSPGYAPPPPYPADPEESEDHDGFFARLDVGLGYAWVGNGSLGPEPGFKPIQNLNFEGVALGVSAQLGGGDEDFAISGELLHERMLTQLTEPSNVSFQLYGFGIGAAYYTDDDFHLGAQLRMVGLLMWREQIDCFWDRGDWSWGPGVGVILGKEWFGGNSSGRGLALHGHYARLRGEPNLEYASLLGKFTLTWF